MRIHRFPAALSALTALTLLAGCSGSDDEPAKAAEQESPLTEYMNSVYGGDLSPEEQEAQYAEQLEKEQELVAQCMQEEGFEYTPDTTSSSFYAGDGTEYQPDDRDWVSQYGYGAVNGPWSESPEPEQEYVDPNGDYVATLSESEQTAFYEALYGPTPSEEELAEDGSYEYDWTTAGCQGAAQHEVAGEDPSQSEEFQPLFEAINGLYQDMATSPAMAELDDEWSACMDAAGHGGFATRSDAETAIYDELNALHENAPIAADGTSTGPDEAALDALGEKEVEQALADLDCREETDYTDRSAEITRELEQQFVDDHKTELDALKAAAEQADE